MLYQSIPSSKSWNVAKLLDLKSLTSPPKPNAENGQPITGGLAGVVTTYLGCTLNKRQQISNWEKRPLTEEQAIYAGILYFFTSINKLTFLLATNIACDAYCLLQIYDCLCKLNHPFLKKSSNARNKHQIKHNNTSVNNNNNNNNINLLI